MTGIEERIAEILRKHRQARGPACRHCGTNYVSPTYTDHVASVLVAELGLTEFECDGDRWWSTKFYPLDDS